jgi:hypothetical protein
MEEATVSDPMFQYGTRWYIILQMSSSGQLRRAKIPFRYNRVMCEVRGDRTIQELVKGDQVQVSMEFVGGVWKVLTLTHRVKQPGD